MIRFIPDIYTDECWIFKSLEEAVQEVKASGYKPPKYLLYDHSEDKNGRLIGIEELIDLGYVIEKKFSEKELNDYVENYLMAKKQEEESIIKYMRDNKINTLTGFYGHNLSDPKDIKEEYIKANQYQWS